MKDYSLNYEDKKRYIKNYKHKKDKIIIKFANRKKRPVLYSKENIQKIESKMEEQARKAEVKPLTPLEETLIMGCPLALPLTVTNFMDNAKFSTGLLFGLTIVGSIIFPSKYLMCFIKENDIEKLHYFLEYKKELNANINNDVNMLLNVSKKATRIIKAQLSNKKEPININNIGKYSLKDLRTIKENIDKISLSYLNENNMFGDQGPVLKK